MHRIDSLTSGRANAVTGNDAAHAALDECSMAKTSEVDGDNVPWRHLGVLLSIKQSCQLADRLQAARTDFIFEPHIRFKGEPGEQATMFFLDPSGNAIEFKAFEHIENLFAK